ncbi:hypothetical protein CPB83DRAFT_904294 [Crepidotus variabilis]|uniref:Uncharacterized protein n=1 Tax=Crepidotus variabilis TaxID=179855 RepID=A0A9P6JSS7_9AGAR|nr:hypothetical protein CPB83DRAFT_904294 [Crepidotus variabilis]
MSGQAGPSVNRVVGTEPGELDKSQRSRLLRHPKAVLSFASFDPYAATAREASDISQLSLQEDRCRPKRIVVETIAGRCSSWRWVPGARKEEGVVDEGAFPRIVVVCGQEYEFSQEQWDIYKLDPVYDCFVRLPPAFTVIALKESFNPSHPISHGTQSNVFGGEEISDGEYMMVDEESPFPSSTSNLRSPKRKQPSQPFDFMPSLQGESSKPKRPAHVSFQSLRQDDDENEYLAEDILNRNTKLYTAKHQKRARTLSPETGKRAVYAHRSKHESKKQARRREEMEARREIRERHFLKEVENEAQFYGNGRMPDIPEDQLPEDPYDETPANDDEQPTECEDPVSASLRKMNQLNADRERERLREKQLGAVEEIRPSTRADQLRAEAGRKRAAEEARKTRVEEEAKLREQQEAALLEARRRKRAEMLAKVERERRHRNEQWLSGPWTTTRAIERYKMTCAFFDKAKFSEESFPLAFIDIPWPSLRHPLHIRPEDIDWQSTNEFFTSLKPVLRGQAYKDFLKQSLQRFHPDRWSSRNLFAAILNEDERNEIDTAVNTVSKALGALYAEARTSSYN